MVQTVNTSIQPCDETWVSPMFLNMSQVLDAADVYETRLRRGCTAEEGHLEGGRECGLELARLGAGSESLHAQGSNRCTNVNEPRGKEACQGVCQVFMSGATSIYFRVRTLEYVDTSTLISLASLP